MVITASLFDTREQEVVVWSFYLELRVAAGGDVLPLWRFKSQAARMMV